MKKKKIYRTFLHTRIIYSLLSNTCIVSSTTKQNNHNFKNANAMPLMRLDYHKKIKHFLKLNIQAYKIYYALLK